MEFAAGVSPPPVCGWQPGDLLVAETRADAWLRRWPRASHRDRKGGVGWRVGTPRRRIRQAGAPV